MSVPPEAHTIMCDWCHREVISFVAPPAMIEVTADPGVRHGKQFWRVCLPCYTDLIKLIATRDWQSTAPGRSEQADVPTEPI